MGNEFRNIFSFMSSIGLHLGAIIFMLTLNLPRQITETHEPVEVEVTQTQEEPQLNPQVATEAPSPSLANAEPEQKVSVAPEVKAPVTAAAKLPSKVAAPDFKEAQQLNATPVAEVQDLDSDEVDSHLEGQAVALKAADLDQAELKELQSDLAESEVIADKAKKDEDQKLAAFEKEAAEKRAQEKAALVQAAALAQQQKLAEEKAQNDAEALARAEKEKKDQEELAKAQAQYEAARASAIAAAQASFEKSLKETNGTSSNQSVRNLEDLRQIPGNPKPFYDEDDRLAKRSGNVVFHAFVNKEGRPSQFKLVQSSGHVTLDKKTFNAIQKWRFYPGQEGWVEIPFMWDLKGEPQPLGGTLRKMSQQQN